MLKVSFRETVTGLDRKAIAAVVAEALGGKVVYEGAPSFAYAAGGWRVGKDSMVTSPEMDMGGFQKAGEVLTALSNAGLNAERAFQVTIHGISESETKILISVVTSKEILLTKSLQVDEPLSISHCDGGVVLPFFNATLDADEATAYLTLALRLAEFARTLKYSSAVNKVVDNQKYALRCFLLRLGFIGDEYKAARKVLLAPLEGNTAFRNKPATGEADAE